MTSNLRTARLDLVPATLELACIALASDEALAKRLGVRLPASWPCEFYGPSQIEYTIECLRKGPEQAGWWMYYFVHRSAGERVLIGSGGFKGPPSDDGTVEVGYSVVTEFQRQGIASEAVGGFVQHAFECSAVTRVIAETLPDLAASIGVLRKCEFTSIGEGPESGVIRFELKREQHVEMRARSDG